jgi:glyoxylase-like metal-dependent hydrolase (beta-lactamase superfamily II)
MIHSGDECAVVDPNTPYTSTYGRVKYVLLTHAHFDHMLDIDSWVDRGGATVIVSRYDKDALSDPKKNCSLGLIRRSVTYSGDVLEVDDGDALTLGDETIEIMATPGHTPGCLVYKIEDTAFVGDLVFAGGAYGRCDLYGGDEDALHQSIATLLLSDPQTMLLPGHGEATTIREYKNCYRKFS